MLFGSLLKKKPQPATDKAQIPKTPSKDLDSTFSNIDQLEERVLVSLPSNFKTNPNKFFEHKNCKMGPKIDEEGRVKQLLGDFQSRVISRENSFSEDFDKTKNKRKKADCVTQILGSGFQRIQ
jgi:hypothetical protein